MAKKRKLATLFVDFVADRTGLKRDMRSAEQDVKRSADNIDKSSKKAGSSLSEMGEKIESKIAPLDKFTSAIGKVAGVLGPLAVAGAAVVGVFKGLSAAVKESTERFRRQRAEARAFQEQIQSLSSELRQLRNDSEDAIQLDNAIGQSNRRVSELADELERMTEGGVQGFFSSVGTGIKGFAKGIVGLGSATEEFAAKAEKASRKLTELQRAQQIRDRLLVESRKKFLDDIERLELRNADEVTRIRREAQNEIEALQKRAKEATFFVDPEEIQRGIDAIRAQRDTQIKAIEDERKAKEEAEREAARKEKERAQEQARRKEEAEAEAEERLHKKRMDNIRAETEARMQAVEAIENRSRASIDAITNRINGQAHVFKQIDEHLRRIADQGVFTGN